jgi:hypothetical protein
VRHRLIADSDVFLLATQFRLRHRSVVPLMTGRCEEPRDFASWRRARGVVVETGLMWNLVRAALIAIGEPADDFAFEATVGGANIRTTSVVTIDGKPAGVVTLASVPTETPVPERGSITIPSDSRREAESALEAIAALLAIDRRATHVLSSPMPFVGFVSDDDPAADLDGLKVDARATRGIAEGIGEVGLMQGTHLAALRDRLDGVSLLGEALNQRTGLGEYLQLMRLFERAFRLGPFALARPLASFLETGQHRHSGAEVAQWADARGAAAHADRRDMFLLTSDVRPFISRMREAAYDVLLNKAAWRSPAPDRRSQWRAGSGSSDPIGGIFVTQGKEANLRLQIFDGFAAYPLVLTGAFDDVLPEAAWLTTDEDSQAVLRISGRWERAG